MIKGSFGFAPQFCDWFVCAELFSSAHLLWFFCSSLEFALKDGKLAFEPLFGASPPRFRSLDHSLEALRNPPLPLDAILGS
jgi:hypothetical protein